MVSGVRILLPVALAFSLAAGAVFAVGRIVQFDDGSLQSALGVEGGAGAIEGIEWSSAVVTPANRQDRVLARQVALSTVLASILALTSLLTALAYELLRGSTRRDELAIHRAVGASFRSLRRSAVSEAAMVTVVGVFVGWALGSSVGELALSRWPGTTLTPTSGAFMLVPTAVLAAAFFTFSYGSWQATTAGVVTKSVVVRPPPADPYSGIAIMQVAGSVVLLITAAVLLNAGGRDREASVSKDGADPDEGVFVATVRGDTPLDTVRLLAGLQRVPGISSAWVTTGGATVGLGTTDIALTECGRCLIGTSPVQIRGEDAVHHAAAWIGTRAPFEIVSGRSFGPEDGPDDELVAVVSEPFAQRNFERGDAVGRRVRPGSGLDGWHRVIGISSSGVTRSGFGSEAQPEGEIYVSAVQHPGRSAEIWVGGTVAEASVLGAIMEASGEADISVRSLQSHLQLSNAPAHWFGGVSGALGLVALLCSLLGIRAVTRLSLSVRRTQVGIHRAVGANRLALARLALGQPLRASLIGTALGMYCSLFFLDALADAAGAPVPTPRVLIGIVLVHVVAALAGALPITVRFARSSPHALITGAR